MDITGQFDPVDGMATQASDINLSLTARNVIGRQSPVFVTALQSAGDSTNQQFFQNVETVAGVPEATDVTSSPVPPAPTGGQEGGDDDDDGLSNGALVAIILCGFFVFALAVALLVQSWRSNATTTQAASFEEEEYEYEEEE